MIDNQETYELIERYLNHELTEQEHLNFEQRLKNEPALKIHTANVKQVHELVFQLGLSQDKKIIQNAEQAYIKKLNRSNYGNWLKGGFLLVATVGTLYYFLQQPANQKNNFVLSPKEPKEKKEIILDSTHLTVKSNKNEPIVSHKKRTEPLLKEMVDTSSVKPLMTLKPTSSSDFNNTPATPPIIAPVNTKTNPCTSPLKAFFSSTPTCKSKNEGTIMLSRIENGKEPFEIKINDKPYEKIKKINFLSEGHYSLSIKDVNGCISETQEVKIESKVCTINKDFIFAYSQNENWSFPLFDYDNFTFILFNSAGEVLTKISIQNGSPSSWNGLDKNQNKLVLGTYPYRIISDHSEILYQGAFTLLD